MTDDLTALENVGPARADDLRAAGFETTAEVRSADVEELTQIDGIGEELAEAIQNEEPNLKNAGRESEIGEYADDLLEAAAIPQTKMGIARDAGLSYRALQNYLNDYADFAAAFRKQRGKAENALIMASLGNREPLNALLEGRDLDVDDKMVQWLLSRSFEYTKTEKRELDADVDANVDQNTTLKVEFNEKVVESPWSPDDQP